MTDAWSETIDGVEYVFWLQKLPDRLWVYAQPRDLRFPPTRKSAMKPAGGWDLASLTREVDAASAILKRDAIERIAGFKLGNIPGIEVTQPEVH